MFQHMCPSTRAESIPGSASSSSLSSSSSAFPCVYILFLSLSLSLSWRGNKKFQRVNGIATAGQSALTMFYCYVTAQVGCTVYTYETNGQACIKAYHNGSPLSRRQSKPGVIREWKRKKWLESWTWRGLLDRAQCSSCWNWSADCRAMSRCLRKYSVLAWIDLIKADRTHIYWARTKI